MRNNKGFTLIELLAVIIILGIFLVIEIPSVTKYISDSRKSAYVNTAKEIGVLQIINIKERVNNMINQQGKNKVKSKSFKHDKIRCN